jgi:uncharacterized protein involved in outer membrane biogenesis
MQASNSTFDRASASSKSARTRKILWWIVGLVAAYAVIGFFIFPLIAKPKLEKELSEALHRKVSIETLRVNPFVPSVTVRGFAMQERTGEAKFVTFDELYVDAGWTSILRLAPVVDEARLSKPHVRLVRDADRKYNCQDLVDAIVAKLTDGKPPPSFALFNLQLIDGLIDIDDRAEERKHEIAGRSSARGSTVLRWRSRARRFRSRTRASPRPTSISTSSTSRSSSPIFPSN